MPGISLLRPQYNSLGAVAGLSAARASGDQDDSLVHAAVGSPFDKPRDRDDRRHDGRDPLAAPAAAAAPTADVHVDPHLPLPERMAPIGLLVADPLAMPELLRAAAQAYGYSRDVLRAAANQGNPPGGQLDAAS